MSDTDGNAALDAALIQDDDSFTGGTQEPITEPSEPQKEEPAVEEPSEPKEEVIEPVTTEEKEPGEEPEKEPEPTDEPQDKQEDARKRHNDEMARQRIASREQRALQQQALSQVNQNYAPTNEEQLIEQGYSPEQAQILALREEINYREQATALANLNATVQQDIKDVERDFDVFNPTSKDYDQSFAEKVTAQWARAARFQTDQDGLILSAELPPYDFFKDAAEMYGHVQVQSSQSGQAEGKAAALKMVAKAETPNGSSQTNPPSKDPVLDELMKGI